MKDIRINAGLIFKTLLAGLVFLAVMGAIAHYLRVETDYNNSLITKQFVRLFKLDELSIPTWYSTSLLLISSMLLGAIAYLKKVREEQYVFHWALLSLIFLFMSIDDAVELHERLNFFQLYIGDIRFKYSWVIFGAAFVLIIFLLYFRFLFNLPSKIRNLFLLGGILFVTGAIGFEIVGWTHRTFYFQGTYLWMMFSTLEESLEMLGTTVFIYALLKYLDLHSNLKVKVDS